MSREPAAASTTTTDGDSSRDATSDETDAPPAERQCPECGVVARHEYAGNPNADRLGANSLPSAVYTCRACGVTYDPAAPS